jgi:hypothetical protein
MQEVPLLGVNLAPSSESAEATGIKDVAAADDSLGTVFGGE